MKPTGQRIAAADITYSWNAAPGLALRDVTVEDDVREALQSVRVRQPTIEERRTLLDMSANVGVRVSFMGFPATSPNESTLCEQLVDYVGRSHIPISPILMARAVTSDVQKIIEIQDRTGVEVVADLYVASSRLRAVIEGWNLTAMLERLSAATETAQQNGLAFRLAFEDSTRTGSDDLRECLAMAVDVGANCVVLNDTAGACLPDGARRHVEFAASCLADSSTKVQIAWHGHNDLGLALANTLAAIEGGASLVSGTFTGLGERTGNLPLEQLLYVKADAGAGGMRLDLLPRLCAYMAHVTGTQLREDLPIVGKHSFSTATGTHVAAVRKAQALGRDFEDAAFSSVSAQVLGRSQELLVGPNSSFRAVAAMLSQIGIAGGDELGERIVAVCRAEGRTLVGDAELAATVDQISEGVER